MDQKQASQEGKEKGWDLQPQMNPSLYLIELPSDRFVRPGPDGAEENQSGPHATNPEDDPY
jgi:hypothetical protein